MRTHFRLSLLTLLLTGLFIFATSPMVVNASSAACKQLNGQAYGPVTIVASFIGSLDIGDTLTITHTGTASHATVQIPSGTTVAVIPKGGKATFTVTTTGISIFSIVNFTGSGDVAGSITCGDAPPVDVDPNAEVLFNPGDGRINHHVADRAAPAAVYCDDGLLVIRVDPVTAKGTDEIRLTAAEVEAAGVPSEGNIILAQTDWAIVARLSDGRFSLNAWYKDGKPYTIVWDECSLDSIEYIAR